MGQVVVKVNGREFQLTCTDGQEARILPQQGQHAPDGVLPAEEELRLRLAEGLQSAVRAHVRDGQLRAEPGERLDGYGEGRGGEPAELVGSEDGHHHADDASGQRVRKVTELANDGGIKDERIYLGGFEVFRTYEGAARTRTLKLERETLHVMDDRQRVALVETRTVPRAASSPLSPEATAYGSLIMTAGDWARSWPTLCSRSSRRARSSMQTVGGFGVRRAGTWWTGTGW
jgi:hypothetical protein